MKIRFVLLSIFVYQVEWKLQTPIFQILVMLWVVMSCYGAQWENKASDQQSWFWKIQLVKRTNFWDIIRYYHWILTRGGSHFFNFWNFEVQILKFSPNAQLIDITFLVLMFHYSRAIVSSILKPTFRRTLCHSIKTTFVDVAVSDSLFWISWYSKDLFIFQLILWMNNSLNMSYIGVMY